MVTAPRSAARLSQSPWADARWLVLAPHADDETIGAGALIREAAGKGRLAGVAFLTDGAASHGDRGPRDLAAIRRAEARRALRRLTPFAPPPIFLDWPDAAPPDAGDPRWARALATLVALCRRAQVDAVAVTSGRDPHCDHKAACALAYALADAAPRPLRVFEYVVWAEGAMPRSYRAFRTEAAPRGPRSLALAAHRSQMTPLHGDGFRVPERLRRMAPADVLYLRSRLHAS